MLKHLSGDVPSDGHDGCVTSLRLGQLGDRRRDAEDLNKRIKQAQAATAAALARQSDLEKQLFDADHEAAKTEADNQKLEREIKTKELGR